MTKNRKRLQKIKALLYEGKDTMNKQHAVTGLLLVTIFSIEPMENGSRSFNFAIKVEQEGSIIRQNLVEVDEPKLSIGICAQCKEESAFSCIDCHGVDYCSTECRKIDEKAHAKDCLKIQQADYGDINRIEGFFKAYIGHVYTTKQKKHLKEALKKHYQGIVRIRQDLACCTDESTKGAIEIVQRTHDQWFKQLIENKIITAEDLGTDQEKTNLLLDAVAWAEERTNDDILVSPDAILQYGMHHFLETIMPQEKKIIPAHQWKEKRLKVLQEYKAKLKRSP